MQPCGLIDPLHNFRRFDRNINVGGKFFSRLHTSDKTVDFILEHVGRTELVFRFAEHLIVYVILHKAATVLKPDAGLIAHEINKHFVLSDILRPGSVKTDDRPVRPDNSSDGIIHMST